MAMDLKDIEKFIKEAMPDASIEIHDLAADGNQKGKTGTVELRISLDSLNGDVESMRREILATCIAHFLEAKTTQYHPDAPKRTKEVTNLNDDEY